MTRMYERIFAAGLVALVVTGASGCYLVHGDSDAAIQPDAGVDGAIVVAPDGRVLSDAGTDAGVDGGIDAGVDAGTDAAVVGVDAEPPVGPTPDPSTCRVEPTIAPFTDPIQERSWPDGPMDHMDAVHVCSTPMVADLDASDGQHDPVVAFVSYTTLRHVERGYLRIWNPRTHETISYPSDAAEPGVMEATGNLAIGDLDGDGRAEIIGQGVASGTFAVHADGSLMWESAFPTARDRGTMWARTVGTAITLADLEGDGTVEVIAGRNVLEGLTGDRRFTGDNSITTRGTNQFLGPISCAADLDGDGTQEVIAGRTAFHHDGTIMWNQTRLSDGFCGVADLMDSNEGPEVVLVSTGYFYVLSGANGDILFSRVLEGRTAEPVGGPPTIADFDGDGRPELGIAHGGAYGVYDLDCTGRGSPTGCSDAGLLWTAPTADDSSAGTGSSVFDFNGDGRAEVVYNNQYHFRVYDGETGHVLFERANSSQTRTENPVVADVDDDGNAEIVFGANAEAFFIRDYWTTPGVFIWGDARGRWVGSRRIWNEHAYHITNVNEDGTIPAHETNSWTTLNAYRQNRLDRPDVLVVPDLWGGHGTYECLGGTRVRLTVNVQNWGLGQVGAGVLVGFYRGRPGAAGSMRLGAVSTTHVLEPMGGSEMVSFETDLTGDVLDYYAVLDDRSDLEGGAVHECREGNNQVLIWRPVCGG